MKSRTKILAVVLLALFASGCGYVSSSDGRTTTIVGFGRTTEGRNQAEWGVGSGMNKNLGTPRDGTFSDRSPAALSALGGN